MTGKHPVPADRGPYEDGNQRTAHASIDGNLITIRDCRDSLYRSVNDISTIWGDEQIDVRELTNLWVYFIQFSPLRSIAHAELSFELADGRCFVASFEVRPLQGQRYNMITGLARTFEITLRWTTERDALIRRLVTESDKFRTYMFEADISHSRMIDVFNAFIARTNRMHAAPEWYHTFTNTCTTGMMDVIHEVMPGQVPRTPRVLLPGMLPKFWAKHGVLKFEGDFEEAFERAYVTPLITEIGDAPELSTRLRDRPRLHP